MNRECKPTFVVESSKPLKGIMCPFCDVLITEYKTNNGYVCQCNNEQCGAYLPAPGKVANFCETVEITKISNGEKLVLSDN